MPSLSSAVHFLQQLIVADLRVGAEIASVAISDDDLERPASPTDERLEVELRADLQWVGVLRQLFLAATEVVRGLADVAEVERDALTARTQSEPVAEEERVVRRKRGGRDEAEGRGEDAYECSVRAFHLRSP